MRIKEILREVLIFFHIDITKNLEYDRLTKAIMKKVVKKNHNCIDIGCHKGEILSIILKLAPSGKHYAFEPIPYLFEELKQKFKNQAQVFPYALANKSGQTTFQLIKNAPAYSGINKRKYSISNPEIEEIQVGLKTLDEMIPTNEKIHFIKIDVEGGEFDVLKGAKNLLAREKPIVIFECGMGASDYYGTQPVDIYSFLKQEMGLNIYTLKSFLENGDFLDEAAFNECYITNKEYYFIAASPQLSEN